MDEGGLERYDGEFEAFIASSTSSVISNKIEIDNLRRIERDLD